MYNHARKQCEKGTLNGKIAVIRNAKENDVVHSLFIATYGHGIDNKFLKSNPSNYLWIGLSRDDEYSEWKWDDSTIPVNYTNWKPNHRQPMNGNYVRMNRQGYWETTTNLMYHPAVCERSAKYVVYKKRLTYSLANEVCANMSMEFAVVKSEEDNDELVAEASRSLGSPYLDRNFENVNQVWVGGYEDQPGRFFWEDGSEAEYQNFEPFYGLEFSGTGSAKISIDKMKKDWKLERASDERSFACQCPSPGQDQYQNIDSFPNVDPGSDLQPVKGEEKCKRRYYADGRVMTFEAARMACRKQGLQLAKIENEAENEEAVRVMNMRQKGRFAPTLYDGANWFWIGGSDVLLEGRFLWEDGTPLNYTNWGKGQPDNAHPLRGGQNYVSVYRGTKLWDDSHAFKPRTFLCFDESVSLEDEPESGCNEQEDFEPGTKDTPRDDLPGVKLGVGEYFAEHDCIKREYHGDYYVASSTATYSDAVRTCEERGLRLASIYNEGTNSRVRNLVMNRVPVSGYVLATMGELSWFWVGLEAKEGEMRWQTNGNQTSYENFKSYNKRNGYTDKDGLVVSKVDGSWEWKSQEDKYMFICEEDKWVCTLSRGKP